MATTPFSDSRRQPVEQPSEVQVTVFRFPGDRAVQRRWVLPAAIAAALVGAVLAVVGVAGPSRGVATAGVDAAGPTGVAAADGYPSTCLTVTISPVNRTFARADFTPRRACGLASGFPTAIFHRFGGEWHPMLYAVRYPCPVPSVPPEVQRELSLCRSAGLGAGGGR